MNVVNIIGQIENDCQVIDISPDKTKKLLCFTIVLPKDNNNFSDEDLAISDQFNHIKIKFWTENSNEEMLLVDQTIVAVNGWIQTFLQSINPMEYAIEIYANKISYLS
ncbi:thioredoxin domain-containing protein [Mycoplasma mycoides]|uniref:hypothetical protein n=1 Tax=Mycoplasma mycoides TaxID=2102 RepID=UPI00223FA39F|nr:hypothetical protein [Mycoplasma mycoides]QVJ96000.1 hypothetical protein I7632_03110 [Mycoplasma mycoides subsp. capri]QVJ96894.1 hypothetical protein I7633_03065 [Mycoplasma mycoides subsp. capri]QVK00757.1 hypothetical protein I7635_03060 [Mycoplasma mycoides subsp. capri]